MVLVDPWLLFFNLGFQLSFLACMGIIALSASLDHWLEIRFSWHHVPRIRGYAASSFAALVATTPLLAAAFGNVSLLAPIVNSIAVAISPLLLLLGLGFLGLAMIAFPIASLASPLLTFLFGAFASLIAAYADAPFASVEIGTVPTVLIGIYYAALLWLCWKHATKARP
jgi:competence protein ComEC